MQTEIEIAGSPDRVWATLIDFPSYEVWNPFFKSASGEAVVGKRLKLTAHFEGGKVMKFQPIVKAAEPSKELRWLGRLLLPGIFDGEHRFQLEALEGGRTKLLHSETFRGILVGMVSTDKFENDFKAMNAALKQRVESQ